MIPNKNVDFKNENQSTDSSTLGVLTYSDAGGMIYSDSNGMQDFEAEFYSSSPVSQASFKIFTYTYKDHFKLIIKLIKILQEF